MFSTVCYDPFFKSSKEKFLDGRFFLLEQPKMEYIKMNNVFFFFCSSSLVGKNSHFQRE